VVGKETGQAVVVSELMHRHLAAQTMYNFWDPGAIKALEVAT